MDPSQFICEICGKEFENEEIARECERKGYDDNTKLPVGIIVKYRDRIYNGDYPDTYEERLGIVTNNSPNPRGHYYNVEFLDLHDLRDSFAQKDELSILLPEEAEKELNEALNDRVEEIDLLKNIHNRTASSIDISTYQSKERRYSRRD